MIEVLAALAAFGAFWLYGIALLSAIRADLADLRVVLTAPVVGAALVTVLLFLLSAYGITMDAAGRPVGIGLAITSAIVLALRRPRIRPAVASVLVVCLVNIALIGRPLLQFGSHWVANANSDSVYYVMRATQLREYGVRTPVRGHWGETGRDYAASTQRQLNTGGRPGADITLGALSATSGIRPYGIFMSYLLALNLCTLCAAGAIAMQAARRWWAAPLAAGLLAIAPLADYGVLQELEGQTFGLAVATALFAWLMREEVHRPPGPTAADLIVISLFTTAFLLIYSELASALTFAYGLYVVNLLLRRRIAWRRVMILWGAALAAIVLVHGTYLLQEVAYIRIQVSYATGAGYGAAHAAPLFGYALVPEALPAMLGLQLLPASRTAVLVGATIIIALIALAAVFVYAVRSARRGGAAATVLLAETVLALALAKRQSDFALFKTYMYMQPFLAATVAVWISSIRRRYVLGSAAVLLLLVGIVQVRNANEYVARSRNPVDLHDGSSPHLLPYVQKVVADAHAPVISVTDNLYLAGMEAVRAGHHQLFFVTRPFLEEHWKPRHFTFVSGGKRRSDEFLLNPVALSRIKGRRCLVLLPTGDQSIVNRLPMPEGTPRQIAVAKCDHYPKNTLVFIHSELGQTFYLPFNRRNVSMYQLERDPMYGGRTFSGFGRYALFMVLNPTRSVRLVLDMTDTFKQDGLNTLPPAAVYGKNRGTFSVVGRGSARLVSSPIRPKTIDGAAFVLLDMGAPGRVLPHPRKGVAALYYSHVPLDSRYLTSWVRDISLIGADQVRRLRAPNAIRSFPAGLADPGVRYSGIFEDGWVSSRSWLELAAGPETKLKIRALVPPTDRTQFLKVSLDGRPLFSQAVSPGMLDTSALVPASSSPRRIELRWSTERRLGPHDRRRASALLRSIALSASFRSSVRFPLRIHDDVGVSTGIDRNGWTQRRSQLVLAGGRAADITVEARTPFDNQLTIIVNGRRVLAKAVKTGESTLRAALPATSRPRTIRLVWSKSGRVSAANSGNAAALLRWIAIEPRKTRAAQSPAERRSGGGVWPDGWLKRNASLSLPAGPAGALDLRFEVTVPDQRLSVRVDGHRVSTGKVAPGPQQLSIPIAQSNTRRRVQLHWGTAAPIAPDDPRVAAALLKSATVDKRKVGFTVSPTDIASGSAPSSGFFGDGWMQKDVRVLLHGGAAGELSLRALIATPGQDLTVVVDGRTALRRRVTPGEADVRVQIGASDTPRLVELHWRKVARIAVNDPRHASALLRSLAVTHGSTTTK